MADQFGPDISPLQRAQAAGASTEYGAYDKATSARGVENAEAKATQKLYEGFGVRLSLSDARDLAKQGRDAERMRAVLDSSKPTFLKDGNGVRGPQRDAKHTEVDGIDGRGKQLQVSRKQGSSGGTDAGSGSAPLEDTTVTPAIGLNVNGSPGYFTPYTPDGIHLI